MGKQLNDTDIKTILLTIYNFLLSGNPKGKATRLTSQTLQRPYITVKNHFDKWIKEALKKYLNVD
jgi:hypothetical protein